MGTPEQVWEVAALVDERYRPMVLLAGFVGLRLGEVLGLQRRDIDLDDGVIVIERQLLELKDASHLIGPPKSDAGRRTLALPPPVVEELGHHVESHVGAEHDAWLFTGVKGGPLRRVVWTGIWLKAVKASSLPEGFRFHDLRHSANTLAAALPGVSTKDLMHRMGHASDRAALRYQHATRRQDAAIAAAIGMIAHGARSLNSTAQS